MTEARLAQVEADLRSLRASTPTLREHDQRQEAINLEFKHLRQEMAQMEASTGIQMDSMSARLTVIQEAMAQRDLAAAQAEAQSVKDRLEKRKLDRRFWWTAAVAALGLLWNILSRMLP